MRSLPSYFGHSIAVAVEGLAGSLSPGTAADQAGPLAAACHLEGGAWTPDDLWLVFNSTLLPSPAASEQLANGSLSRLEARPGGGDGWVCGGAGGRAATPGPPRRRAGRQLSPPF